MGKLNQVIAVEKDVKKNAFAEITRIHHALQQQKLLVGLSRTYEPLNEDGIKYPSESQLVQLRANEVIEEFAKQLTKLFDVTATKDWANCEARADVVVDGSILLTGVPVSYLLFLEKQLQDIHTFVKKLPGLDPSEKWTWDDATNCYRSEPKQTMKTAKKPFPFVKAAATQQHPAQVEVVHQDVVEGSWTQVFFCGGLPATTIGELVVRVQKLIAAVKMAREEANSIAVQPISTGDRVFGYLFAKMPA